MIELVHFDDNKPVQNFIYYANYDRYCSGIKLLLLFFFKYNEA